VKFKLKVLSLCFLVASALFLVNKPAGAILPPAAICQQMYRLCLADDDGVFSAEEACLSEYNRCLGLDGDPTDPPPAPLPAPPPSPPVVIVPTPLPPPCTSSCP